MLGGAQFHGCPHTIRKESRWYTSIGIVRQDLPRANWPSNSGGTLLEISLPPMYYSGP